LPPFFVTEYVGKDGRRVPVEGRTSIIEDRDGTPIGFQAMCRDISVRKILEQQRADFLAMLTHDIRNPLSVIGSYAELLRPVVQEFGEREDILGVQRIENNARTVNALITNYLQLSKIEAGHLQFEKQPVQLNVLLQTLELQYAQDAQLRRIHLQFALQDDLPLAVADTSATDRILANLLHNALKFTPERGCVTVRSFLDEEEIGVSVTDTGPGIGSPELLTIFDKYQKAQAGQQREGSGLGLFIVKTFTERQGGRIEVQSSVGQGSCFTVFLPVAAPRGRLES
jgi:signal transduction histidine kinase